MGHATADAAELFIMAATFAAMVLLYTLFAKFVPIIAIWELKAGLPSRMTPPCWREDAAVDAPRRGDARRDRSEERASMKAIYGLYEDPHVAQQAVDNCAPPESTTPTSR